MFYWCNSYYKLTHLKFLLNCLIVKFIILNSIIRIRVTLRHIGCKKLFVYNLNQIVLQSSTAIATMRQLLDHVTTTRPRDSYRDHPNFHYKMFYFNFEVRAK